MPTSLLPPVSYYDRKREMKQKVIVYNADGNSIRYRTTGLEQAREHVSSGNIGLTNTETTRWNLSCA